MAALETWQRGMVAAVALFLTLGTAQVWAAPRKAEAKAIPAPVKRIPVAPLGFLAPNPSYLNLRPAWTSLNFIDDKHLLFTFHVNKLLPRLPGDTATDNDQEIRADVLDIATGKVVRQAHWRMHDRGRYLWALPGGKFLVRIRNSLFMTDRSLTLKPYLKFDSNLQEVEISPGGSLLLVEVAKKPPLAKSAKNTRPSLLSPSGVATQTRTELILLRTGGHKALASGETGSPVALPLADDGYFSVEQGTSPHEWVVHEKFVGKPKRPVAKLGTVKSSCPPKAEPLGGGAVLVEGCLPNGRSGKPVTVLQLKHGVLWRDMWRPKYIWPEFALDRNGGRFALESLEMDRGIGVMDAFGESDVVAQLVGVFDTDTDKAELIVDASPVLSGGRNFALSADGRRFAVLREGAIEVYDLPPRSSLPAETKAP